tara:strand:- start:149 stop:610 length:462 start_codon:yes stop_codon:yes gene_type:complete
MDDSERSEKYNGYTKEEWQIIVSHIINKADRDRTAAAEYVSKISAWMIGQLFIVNAGAITIIGVNGDKWALLFFALGILLALACSLSAWFHAVKEYEYSDLISDPKAMIDQRFFPKPDEKIESTRTNAYMATLVFGILSIAAFAIGAICILIN